MKNIKVLIKILIFCFYSACSPSLLYKAEPLILDKKTLFTAEESPNTLKGSGRILFDVPLFGLHSKELYFIKARFFNEDSFLTLHSHFTGFDKQDGIQISFVRDKNRLIINALTPHYPAQPLYVKDNYFSKNQILEVRVQIQNGIKNFIHIKIWNLYINPTGYLKINESTLTKQNLMANSSDLIFYSKGQGMLWGMELDKIHLLTVFRESVSQ